MRMAAWNHAMEDDNNNINISMTAILKNLVASHLSSAYP